jgi:hypothetical protein
VGSEDIANRLLQADADFRHFVQRLDDDQLDAFLIAVLKLYEQLTMDASRSTIMSVERRLRQLKQEQQRRAMPHLMSFARSANSPRFKLVRPPQLVYAPLLQRFLPPAAYKRYVEPHIADMHAEYFACIAAGDQRGARWAVIRAHLYAVPSWIWALVGSLIARVIEWIRT